MKMISPLLKGIITAIIMLAVALAPFYSNVNMRGLEYFVYVAYAGGIGWTLIDYSRSPDYTGKFKDIFGQGFRCFIIVTLIMVAFTAVSVKMHPEYVQESAVAMREELVKQKDKTPAEIDQMVKDFEKSALPLFVFQSIFGYLVSGALFTVAGTTLLIMIRRR